VGTSAPEPDLTWSLAQSSSCTFGEYPDQVRVTVDDDGSPGTAIRSQAGCGLVGMRERATMLDAQPDIEVIGAAADGREAVRLALRLRPDVGLFDVRMQTPTSRPRQPMEPLTAREEEVIVPVAQGRTNAEIAGELYITQSTVKAHIAALMRKLGARNRVEVAMWAHETGRS
jgi:DNA-binding NarL/FixJ family response regulator